MFLLENPSIIKAIKISGLKPFDPKYLRKNKDIHRNITIFFRTIQSNVSLLLGDMPVRCNGSKKIVSQRRPNRLA
jgi:hypothetical protein